VEDIRLSKDSPTPLYRQLGDEIKALIESGRLAPQAQLPPIRGLASALQVNNVTVVNAYKYLESLKYVYSMVGSGTFVSDPAQNALPAPILKNEYNATQALSGDLKQYINFADTATMSDLFPVAAFKQAFDAVLTRDGGSAFDYQDSQGYAPLRESLCALLKKSAVKTSPERVQIISGAQQGLDILAKAMLLPGDTLLVERPTFYGAVGAFASRGAQVIDIPLDESGPDPDRLETLLKAHRPKAMYLMPNFQTPTGISYSLDTKRRVLELAYKYNTYIIEEDNQNDFYYDRKPRVPLKALDYRNQVIYIKSFSKILMPGLRMGFMVCPKKISVTTVKRNTDIATSGYIQRAFDLYLRDGDFGRHCAHMRTVYARRYRKAVKMAVAQLAPYANIGIPGGGLSLWFELKDADGRQAEALCNRFLQQRVIVSPGALFSLHDDDMPCFRISFASVSEAALAKGIDLIASVIKQPSWKHELSCRDGAD
jgi:DNA-binding transcriptional MocR family regulator